jgi:hypothetical protein
MSTVDLLSTAARSVALDALATVAWADGRLSSVESSALRGATAALDRIGPRDASRVPSPAAGRSLYPADFAALTERERHLVLAAASWMALVDAKRTPSEARALDEVARLAGLDDEAAELLFDVARWVRQVRPRAGSTWAEEFDRLVRVADGALGPARPGAPRASEGMAQ